LDELEWGIGAARAAFEANSNDTARVINIWNIIILENVEDICSKDRTWYRRRGSR